MGRTDIKNLKVAEIDTIEGVLDVLKNYSDAKYLEDTILREACRNILGEDWELYKDKSREEIIDVLQKMEPELEMEDARVTVEEIKMESKSLGKDKLKELIEDLDIARAQAKPGENYQEIVKKFVESQKGLNKNQVIEAIKTLTEVARVAELEKVSVGTAEKIVEAIEEIKLVAPELGQEKAEEVAVEIIVEGNESVINSLDVSAEAREDLAVIAKGTVAAIRADEKIEIAAELAAKEYQEVLDLDEAQTQKVVEDIKNKIEYQLEHPFGERDETSVINVVTTENGKIKVELANVPEQAKGEFVFKKTGGRVYASRPADEKTVQKLGVVDKKVGETIEKFKNDADVAGKLLGERDKNFLKKGMGREERAAAGRFVPTATEQHQLMQMVVDNGHFVKTEITENAVYAAKTFNSLVRSRENVGKSIEVLDKLAKKYGSQIPELEKANKAAQSIVATLGGAEKGIKSLEVVRKMLAFQEKLNEFANPLTWLSKIKGLEGLAKFGVQSSPDMMVNILSQIQVNGLSKGLTIALQQLGKNGAVAVATGGTEVAAAGTAALASNPVGWLIFAGKATLDIWSNVFKQVRDRAQGVVDQLNLGIKTGLGKGADAMVAGIGLVTAGIIGFGGVLMGAMSIPIWGIALVFLLAVGIPQFETSRFMNIVTMIVPNRNLGGGNCVLIQADNTGKDNPLANCSAGGSVTGTTHINKQNFVQMSGGSVNADRCFADVIDRAKRAGVDPEFALLIWLQESGASNYGKSSDVADFGQSALGNRHDFNNQISMFLGLYPETKCLNSSKIGDNYWLAWATNFATGDSGENCDPNKVVGGVSGQQYLDKIKAQWSQMTNGAPFPASMRTNTGGVTGTTETVKENGDVMICEINPNSPDSPIDQPVVPMPTRDPSIPIPEGCPKLWPVSGNYPITQGPGGAYTHSKIPGMAIDIMPKDAQGRGSIGGQDVVVTHPGVVVYSGFSGAAYGNLIIVRGTCEGKNFVTYYAHLMDSQLVGANTTVAQGQTIGLADNSGNYRPGNDHVHYEIRGCGSDSGHCSGTDGFFPNQYLPLPDGQEIPYGCFWNCGVSTSPNPTPTP